MIGKAKITGDRELKLKLAKLPKAMQGKIGRQSLAEAAKHYRKEIRANTPKDKGDLRKAVRFKIRRQRVGSFKGMVGVTKDGFYALFLEYGTAPHRVPNEFVGARKTKRKNKAKVVIGGDVFSSANVGGIKARPFLRPTFKRETPNVLKNVRKFIWKRVLQEMSVGNK